MLRRILIGIALAAALAFIAMSAAQAHGTGPSYDSHGGQHALACGGVLIGGDAC